MEIILIIIGYALGVILTYGRFTASEYEKNEIKKLNNPTRVFVRKIDIYTGFLMMMSWMGFFVGVLDYFQKKQKYFLKWSFDGLNK